ncbi:MAG: thioredoxin domain-containing protein [Chloroflexi bacterium]|nr:thioredoxin domain-containing protein [Chloroflexota bacterium]
MKKRQLLREKHHRETRQRRIILIGGIVLVAVAVVGWLIYQNTRPVGSYVTVTSTPPPNSDGSALGSPDAKVTVMAFEDFQCPVCRIFSETIWPRIVADYVETGKIRYDFRHVIVIDRGGSESRHAAEASECAAEQGWFWPYETMLFANQTGENVGDFTDNRLNAFATALGLDTTKFESCFNGGKYRTVVDADIAAATQLNIQGTPSVYVPGHAVLEGLKGYEVYQQAIDAALAAAGK